MKRKAKKGGKNIFKIATKDPNKSAKEFMQTVKSGKGNLGKGFFTV